MLQVCTINASNYLGRGIEYTNILFDMIRRNLPEGFEGKFTVFTDGYTEDTTDNDGYDYGIHVRPLPHSGLNGWWNKLALFKPDLFSDGDRVVYIDLSTLITGRLDNIFAYDGDFAILRDFYRGGDAMQSAFMMWPANYHAGIWKQYEEAGFPNVEGGDQAWIEQYFLAEKNTFCFDFNGNYSKLQDIFPDEFSSYKVSCGAIPEKATVVKFHGEPRPHDVLDGWVPRVWKVGGMTRAELDVICNTENEVINNNILHAVSLDLPWFDFDYSKHAGQACIVGGGPSLSTSLDQLKWRKSQGQEIFSANGTHDYLVSNGIMPDYHLMLDARPENVRFVKNPKQGVKYLVASQCDKSIFDALNGYDVTIFHNTTRDAEELLSGFDKPTYLLGGGTTVGIKSMLIAELMGFRAIHLFGMDSCHIGGEHHAYTQTMNDGERIVDVLYEDRDFKCSGWMVSQAQDFIDFCKRYAGVTTVYGDGLLAYIARCGIPESAADERAREILSRLPEGGIGAEIGVFAGDLSSRLLRDEKINLFMVDSWVSHSDGKYADSGDFHATLTQAQQDAYMQMAINATAFAKERRVVIRNNSVDAAKEVIELDFVFIDADHSYEGCRDDIAAWYPNVKKGGLISGHDYSNTAFPCFGVNKAVDEFIEKYGLTLELGDNFTWFARK